MKKLFAILGCALLAASIGCGDQGGGGGGAGTGGAGATPTAPGGMPPMVETDEMKKMKNAAKPEGDAPAKTEEPAKDGAEAPKADAPADAPKADAPKEDAPKEEKKDAPKEDK